MAVSNSEHRFPRKDVVNQCLEFVSVCVLGVSLGVSLCAGCESVCRVVGVRLCNGCEFVWWV